MAQFIYPGELVEPSFMSDGSAPSTSSSASAAIPLEGSQAAARWARFVRLISDSCLVPTLQSYLRNDSGK